MGRRPLCGLSARAVCLMPERPSSPPPADESPGVPGFRSWRGVYWFVFGCFALFVVLLTIFEVVYA